MKSKPLKYVIEITIDDENTIVITKCNRKRYNVNELLNILTSTIGVTKHLSEQLCKKEKENEEEN